MDEKVAVALNAAFKKQLAKRDAAPAVSGVTALGHVDAVSAVSPDVMDGFFANWDKYYPTIVSLLGYASWFFPPKVINILKALLAVINNQLIPIVKDAMK